MIRGTLEHALAEIEREQKDRALQVLLKRPEAGVDPAYLMGLCSGEVRGLELAKQILARILTPDEPKR